MTTTKPCNADRRLRRPARIGVRNVIRGLLAVGAGALALQAALALRPAAALQPAAAWRGDAVKVDLEGTVAAKCGLNVGTAAETTVTIPNLLKPATYRFTYGFSCNTPFQYAITSQNGALALDGPAAGEGIVTRLPYDVGVRIPTDGGVIDDRCSSESIAAGRAACALHDSGAAIAVEAQATLTLALPQPRQPMAISAGRYTDRLTFTIAARP